MKENGGWWKGDYGGKKQHLFPAIYVEEMEIQESSDENVCSFIDHAFINNFNFLKIVLL